MRLHVGALALLALAQLASCKKETQRSWIIAGGRWLDVESGTLVDNTAIVVRNGRIEALLGPGDAMPDDVTVLDASGLVILPGLMDSHVHVTAQDPNGTTGVAPALWDVYRGEPYVLDELLDFGVTSIRDPGGAPALPIRDAVHRGDLRGPEILAAGPFLYAPGGFPANVLEPAILARFVGVATNDPEKAREFVRDRKREGADFVKVIYTSGVFLEGEYPPDAPEVSQLPSSWFEKVPILPREVLVAAIDEANKQGLKVAVHLNRYSEARDALDAGAHWIHHNWHTDDSPEVHDFFAKMAANGVCLDPTLTVHATRFPAMLHYEQVMLAYQAGVMIDAGTDIGFGAGASAKFGEGTWMELHLLAQAGMTPIDVLRSATIVGARCLGIEATQGSVSVGKRADLLVVAVDPLADFDAFEPESIRGVLADGALVRWDE